MHGKGISCNLRKQIKAIFSLLRESNEFHLHINMRNSYSLAQKIIYLLLVILLPHLGITSIHKRLKKIRKITFNLLVL